MLQIILLQRTKVICSILDSYYIFGLMFIHIFLGSFALKSKKLSVCFKLRFLSNKKLWESMYQYV